MSADIQAYRTKWSHLDIEHLILSTDEFIVFIDKELDIDWETTDGHDAAIHGESLCQLNEILNLAATIECIPNDHQRRFIRTNFKRMVGEGVARALKGDFTNAHKILERANDYITSRNIETARYWQLTTSLIAGITAAFSGILLWSFRDAAISVWGVTGTFAILSGLAGAIGATFSIVFRIGSTQITSEAAFNLHVLEALSRIVAGSISGLIFGFLIRIGVIAPFLSSSGNIDIVIIAAAILAGASERWAPSLIEQVEKNTLEPRE